MTRGNLTTANRITTSGQAAPPFTRGSIFENTADIDRSKSLYDRRVSVWFRGADLQSAGSDHKKNSPLTPTEPPGHISIKKSNESLLPAAKIQFYQARRQNATHESALRHQAKRYGNIPRSHEKSRQHSNVSTTQPSHAVHTANVYKAVASSRADNPRLYAADLFSPTDSKQITLTTRDYDAKHVRQSSQIAQSGEQTTALAHTNEMSLLSPTHETSKQRRDPLATDSFVSAAKRTDPTSPSNDEATTAGGHRMSKETHTYSRMAVGLKMHVRTTQDPELPEELAFVPFEIDKQKLKPRKLRIPNFQM